MEKLVFDSGVKEYQLGDLGVLRFNPSDPNVYARFMESVNAIQEVESKLVEKARALQNRSEDIGEGVLKIMAEADREAKAILSGVFCGENDFEKILGGVNLLAVAGNGERVITNLLNALQPIMVSGAQNCAQQKASEAVAKAQMNRANRSGKKRRRK